MELRLHLSDLKYFFKFFMYDAQELWLHFCSDDTSPLKHLNFLLSTARNITELYCTPRSLRHIADHHEELLQLNKPQTEVPCHSLQQIHVLHAIQMLSDRKDWCARMRAFLEGREASGLPVKAVYLYLLSSHGNDASSRAEPEQDVQLQKLVDELQGLQCGTRVELIRTESLPEMKVPEHCKVQSGDYLWDWPTWNDFKSYRTSTD
ncbi:hypothetical protein EIP86_003093 [Pleurotus ostreatoroseus]|nr:hypothetical protein EIP86_003093 [Pleurotus ostreatoroseus]